MLKLWNIQFFETLLLVWKINYNTRRSNPALGWLGPFEPAASQSDTGETWSTDLSKRTHELIDSMFNSGFNQ